MWTYHIPKLLHWDVAAEGHCSELIAMLKKQYWADWALWHDALFGSMHCGDTGMDTVATILSTNWTLFKQDTHTVTSPQAWTDILTLPSKHYSKGGNFTVSHSNLVNVTYQLVTQTAATHCYSFLDQSLPSYRCLGGMNPSRSAVCETLRSMVWHHATCYMLHSKSLKSQFDASQILSLNFRQSYWPCLLAQMHCMVGWSHVCVERQLNSVPNKVAVSVCPQETNLMFSRVC